MRPGFRAALRIILPIVAVVAAWRLWDNVEHTRIAAVHARIAPLAKAEAVNSDSRLQPWDQGNDAAPLYAAAAMAARRGDGPDGRLLYALFLQRGALSRGETPAPDVIAAAAEVMARNQTALRLLDEANAQPFRAFTHAQQFSQRVFGLLTLARAAAHRTLERIQAGDGDGAVDALLARLTLLRVLGRNAWGDGEIEAQEAREIGTDVGALLTWTSPAPARLDEVSRALVLAEERLDLVEVFANIALSHHDFVRAAGEGRVWQYGTPGTLLRPALLRNARLSMLTAEDGLAAARLPWPRRVAAMTSVSDRGWLVPLPGVVFIEAWRVAWRLQRITAASASGVASLRAARALLADAVKQPADGEDPFDGEPLRQIRDDRGVAVYSIGPDGKDDGGVLTATPKKGAVPGTGVAPDIGVRVVYRRVAASTSPSNSGRNSPVR